MSQDQIIEPIASAGAPAPGGHYAQAIRHGTMLFISGQLPIRPDGRSTLTDSFEQQADQAISNLLAILEAGGSEKSKLLKVTVYLVGVANWPAFNGVYARHLGSALPARSVVPVPELHHGYLVEIDAIAAV